MIYTVQRFQQHWFRRDWVKNQGLVCKSRFFLYWWIFNERCKWQQWFECQTVRYEQTYHMICRLSVFCEIVCKWSKFTLFLSDLALFKDYFCYCSATYSLIFTKFCMFLHIDMSHVLTNFCDVLGFPYWFTGM